jgi:hypothetical protein
LYDANGSDVIATKAEYPLIGAPEGALVGRIGTHPPFLVGNGSETPAGQTGHLVLVINDDLSNDGAHLKRNIGQVTISVKSVS